MNELASLRRKSAAPRYSEGSDKRPNMFSRSHISLRPGSSSKFFLTIGVMIFPKILVSEMLQDTEHTWTKCVDSDGLSIDDLSPLHGETSCQLAYSGL